MAPGKIALLAILVGAIGFVYVMLQYVGLVERAESWVPLVVLLAAQLLLFYATYEAYRKLGELKRFVQELRTGCQTVNPGDDLADVDDVIFQRIRTQYINLPWQQKVALKRVWSRRSLPAAELILGLENSGFQNPRQFILLPLLEASAIVETSRPNMDHAMALAVDGTEISVRSSEVVKVLKKLFSETPLC